MGATLGRYELLGVIGRGGNAVVHRARSPDGRIVAIKILTRLSSEARERFAREARILADLGETAGFVPLIEIAEGPLGPYVVMPLLEGGTLRDRLAAGPLAVSEAIELGRVLAEALGRAHARGVIHRDVKPENILFADAASGGRAAGRPLLADLGLAKHFASSGDGRAASLSRTGELLGTAAYMAPEQVRDAKHTTPAADVFALGAVVAECLTGEPVFAGESIVEVLASIMSGTVASPREVRPEVPAWLADAVLRALAPDPRARWADGRAFAAALDGGSVAPPGRSMLRLAVIGAVVAGGCALAFVTASRRPGPGPTETAPVESGGLGAGPSGSTTAGPMARRAAAVSSAALESAREGVSAFAQELSVVTLMSSPESVSSHAARAVRAVSKVKGADASARTYVLAPLVASIRRLVVVSPARARDLAPRITALLDPILEPFAADELPAGLQLERAMFAAWVLKSNDEVDGHSRHVATLARSVKDDPMLAGVGLCIATDILTVPSWEYWGDGAAEVFGRELAQEDEAQARLALVRDPDDLEAIDIQRHVRFERRRDAHMGLANTAPTAERGWHTEQALRLSVEALEAARRGEEPSVAGQALKVHLELRPPADRTRAFFEKHRALLVPNPLYAEFVRVVESDPARALELTRERRRLTTTSVRDRRELLAIEVNALIDLDRLPEARAGFVDLEGLDRARGTRAGYVAPLDGRWIAARLRD